MTVDYQPLTRHNYNDMSKIFTIGFSGKSPDAFMDVLNAVRVRAVWDIRLWRHHATQEQIKMPTSHIKNEPPNEAVLFCQRSTPGLAPRLVYCSTSSISININGLFLPLRTVYPALILKSRPSLSIATLNLALKSCINSNKPAS